MFVRNDASLEHFSQRLGSGSSVLVSETHRVLHEPRLITLLPETIHTDLTWPLSYFTNRFISRILLLARITSSGFITSSRFLIYGIASVLHHSSNTATLVSQRDSRFNRCVFKVKMRLMLFFLSDANDESLADYSSRNLIYILLN